VGNDGEVYVGGEFTSSAGVTLNGIAKWDGVSWTPLGSGVSGYVSVLLVDASGDLYAAGYFETAGGVTANNIAKWNGSSWSGLGTGLVGWIGSLATDSSGHLYAGGELMGGQNVATWNGSNWAQLSGVFDDDVYALATDAGGNVYAGGYFETIDGAGVNHIARWNGSNWSTLGSGFGDPVLALAFNSAGILYAGGLFQAGASGLNYIASWNGTAWSALGTGVAGEVDSLTFDSHGNLYAGGWIFADGNFVQKWNGTGWSIFGGSLNADVVALATRGDDVYAGGYFTRADNLTTNYVTRVRSGAWVSMGAERPGCGANSYITVMASDQAGNIFAAGELMSSAGGVAADRGVFKWNGRTWSATAGLPGYAYAVAVDLIGRVYAGGEIIFNGENNIAVWDGSSWTALPGSFDGDVRTLAFDSSGNLYAGGTFTHVDGNAIGGIAKWNGSTWTGLGAGIDGDVWALASDGIGNLYVGGEFSAAGGLDIKNVARWNGTGWSGLGAGIGYYAVWTLAYDRTGGKLYAGGWFSRAGNTDVSSIACWNGTSWTDLAGGVDGWINSIVVDSVGSMYATGWFSTAGVVPANSIAKWNGSSWSALGSGLDYEAYCLALDPQDSLYVGGYFLQAGGKSSSYIAEWSQSSPNLLPMNNARFKANLVWRAGGFSGAAQAVSLSSDSGYFWFFGPTNLEILMKVLDGRGVNGYFWVFYGALTDVEYDLVITDSQTGAVRTYHNPAGVQAGKNDTAAFSDLGVVPAGVVSSLQQETQTFKLLFERARREGPLSLIPKAQASILQLQGGRFTVNVQWSAPGGATGEATGVALTSDSGYFWFFSAGNIELVVKLLDSRGVNGHFWFFYGALSDVGYTITVRDTQSGQVQVYQGQQGVQKSGYDLTAF